VATIRQAASDATSCHADMVRFAYRLSRSLASVTTEGLRRQTKGPQKGLAHSARINKPGNTNAETFRAGLLRGKDASRLRAGSNIVRVDPETDSAFPTNEAVDEALGTVLKAAKNARVSKGR
jgi:hypothetical protein